MTPQLKAQIVSFQWANSSSVVAGSRDRSRVSKSYDAGDGGDVELVKPHIGPRSVRQWLRNEVGESVMLDALGCLQNVDAVALCR